jgi:hypothetical protein
MIACRSILAQPGDLSHQGLDCFGFWHFSDNLAMDKNQKFTFAPRDADIRMPGFAGAIDCTSHYGNLERRLDGLEASLNLAGDADQVNAGAAAGRAADQLRASPAQA